MNKLYKKYIKTESLPTLFCPGCGNGIIQYAAIEAFEKLGCADQIACVSGIGCSSWIPCYYKLDVMHTMHGRALAFAEGLKLAQPDKKIVVFTGDGDCVAIGGNHLLHAAARNIDLTVIMVNNYIYGMTGGQKSPTTPKGSRTKTSPFGSIDEPIDSCKLVTSLGASYVARWTTAHPVQLEKAIAAGITHRGFSYIEVLAQCPVQAGKNVYGEKDPSKIMENYKKQTYVFRPPASDAKAGKGAAGAILGPCPDLDEKGRIPLGLLHYDPEALEYLDRVEAKLKAEGVR